MAQFDTYLNELQKNLKKGDATEHTHRPAPHGCDRRDDTYLAGSVTYVKYKMVLR